MPMPGRSTISPTTPTLDPDDKIERLDGFARAVRGAETGDPAFGKAHHVRRSLEVTRVTPRHCVDLTRAFIQDATKLRYADWNDLIGYCELSASPVGRYLVDLHGESKTAYPACDALCNALQVLNHLQDCGADYNSLNRVYLPQNWMAAAGGRRRGVGRPAFDSGTQAGFGSVPRCHREAVELG